MGSSTIILAIFANGAEFVSVTLGQIVLAFIALVAGAYAFWLSWGYFKIMVGDHGHHSYRPMSRRAYLRKLAREGDDTAYHDLKMMDDN